MLLLLFSCFLECVAGVLQKRNVVAMGEIFNAYKENHYNVTDNKQGEDVTKTETVC